MKANAVRSYLYGGVFTVLVFVFAMIGLRSCTNGPRDTKAVDSASLVNRKWVSLVKSDGSSLSFVKVTINGHETWMLVDSGSGSTLLDLNQSDKLGIEYSMDPNAKFTGIGGSNDLGTVLNVDSIRVSGVDYPVRLEVTDLDNVVRIVKNATGLYVSGILGSDFMDRNNCSLDYSSGKLFLGLGN